MSLFAKQLTKLRKEAGMSQSELALSVNVNHSLISRFEGNVRIPSREIAARLSLRLDHEEMPTLIVAAGYIPQGYETLNESELQDASEIIIELVSK